MTDLSLRPPSPVDRGRSGDLTSRWVLTLIHPRLQYWKHWGSARRHYLRPTQQAASMSHSYSQTPLFRAPYYAIPPISRFLRAKFFIPTFYNPIDFPLVLDYFWALL